MRLPRSIRRSVARKLLVAVALPAIAFAAVGLAWLWRETRDVAPGLFAAILAAGCVLAAATIAIHFAAVNGIVKRPLRALMGAMRRAREGEWLARVPTDGEDEIAELARAFDATLNAIVDLNVLRADDALAMSSLRRELVLKEKLEEQHRLVDAANRALESRVRELTILTELSRALNATLDLDALCGAVVEAIGRRLGFGAFALFLVDEEGGDLVVKSSFGVGDRAQGSRLALGDGVAGMAAQEKRVVLVRDVVNDPRTSVRSWLPAGAGSLLAAPLVHQGECVGVLDFWRDRPDAFAEDEIRFLESVAGQAAMAVANARLHHRTVALSLTDTLTGVLNRRGLAERLRMELDRAARFGQAFALAIVDVDRLKLVLEGDGLVAGDVVLRDLAGVLRARLRDVDVLARYRGDKFAVVLPRADRAGALVVADALRASVERAPPEAFGGRRITVSVGVASYPEDATELEALVDAADAALFAAKRAGRNAVRACAPGMRDDPARPQKGRVTARLEPGA